MRYKNKIDGKLYSIIKYANRRVVLQAECGLCGLLRSRH